MFQALKTTNLDKISYGVSASTPLGLIWAATSAKGLVAIEIGGTEESFIQKLASRFGVTPTHSNFEVDPFLQQIEAYLQGNRQRIDISIDWEHLSPFQHKVLQAVCAIPYGETRTYGQIAIQLESPRAARAVGRANATNPMPLVVPCHRLVGADGSLRGYGSGEGIKTKAWLLDMERRQGNR